MELLDDFVREARTTRVHVSRVPEAQFRWRPHPKSYSAGQLASHLVECIRFAAPIMELRDLHFDTSTFRPYVATTSEELLATYDAEVARATDALRAAPAADATKLWRVLLNGRMLLERPRDDAFRDMTLHHVIHHRGQLSVYLRLLDVPVPQTYGPTADEQ